MPSPHFRVDVVHKMGGGGGGGGSINRRLWYGQVEKADTVGRGHGSGRGHGRGYGHGHEPNSFFSPLQCSTEAKHGYSLAKSCLLSLLLASFPGSPTREQK